MVAGTSQVGKSKLQIMRDEKYDNDKLVYCLFYKWNEWKITKISFSSLEKTRDLAWVFQHDRKENHHNTYIIFVIKIKEAVICVMKHVNGTISLDLTRLCLSLDLLMQFLFVKLLQQPFWYFLSQWGRIWNILQLFWRTTFLWDMY